MSQGEQSAAALPSVAQIRAGQNLGLAVAAGLATAVGSAIAWAVITVATEMELGIAAVAVGFAVGKAVCAVGKGIDQTFGIAGALCALLGCVLGNLLSALAFYAKAQGLDAGAVLTQLSPDLIARVMTATFSPMDLVFYAIAVYEGYRFSFKYRVRKA